MTESDDTMRRARTGASIRFLLEADHRRLEGFLELALRGEPEASRQAYVSFRLGLLRHIAMEEKILAPTARQALGKPHPLTHRLRVDHSLLATLLIPPPTQSILAEIAEILHAHNELEEGDGGFYQSVEDLAPARIDSISQDLVTFRDPRPARHAGTEAVMRHLEDLRERRRRLLDGKA